MPWGLDVGLPLTRARPIVIVAHVVPLIPECRNVWTPAGGLGCWVLPFCRGESFDTASIDSFRPQERIKQTVRPVLFPPTERSLSPLWRPLKIHHQPEAGVNPHRALLHNLRCPGLPIPVAAFVVIARCTGERSCDVVKGAILLRW